MTTRLFRAALAAAAILLPLQAHAENGPAQASLPAPAYGVVDRLLADRQRLALDSLQVVELTRLGERLRAHRGRLELVGFNRVPGKSVPRYIRVYPSAEEALRSALDLLTPDQRAQAVRLLGDSRG